MKLINNVRWKWVFLTSYLGFSIFLYAFYGPIFAIGLSLATIAFLIIPNFFKPKKYKFSFGISQLIILFLAIFIILTLLYGFAFFSTQPGKNVSVEAINQTMISVGYSIAALIYGLMILAAYLICTIPWGYLLSKNILGGLFNKFSILEKYLFSLLTGMVFMTCVMFFLAGYSVLNFTNLIIVFAISSLASLYVYNINSKSFSKYFKTVREYKLSGELDPMGICYAVLILLALIEVIIFSLQTLPTGSDGFRLYLNLVKEISNNGRLPTTSSMLIIPFITEVFLAPAFKLGGSLEATFILKILSLHIIIPIILIAKKISANRKILFWTLVPAIFFPPFLRIILGEFKIDMILSLIQLSGIYLFLVYFKEKKINYLYLSAIFLGFSVVIKLTSIFMVTPFVLLMLFTYFKNKTNYFTYFKNVLFILVILASFLLMWLTFYKSTIPIAGNFGLGLFPVAHENPPPVKAPECISSLFNLEQEKYYGFKRNPLEYLYLIENYTMPTRTFLNFGLGEIGIWFPSITLLALFYIIKTKKISRSFSENKILVIISLISLVPFFILTPVYPWYSATSFILVFLLLTIYLSRTSVAYIARNFILFALLINLISFVLPDAISNYVPPTTSQPYGSKAGSFAAFHSSEEVGKKVNENPKQYILLSSSTPFSNINYHIANYFDRSIYYDQFDDIYNEESFKDLNNTYNFKYLILNKVASRTEIECARDINDEMEKNVFTKYGKVIYEDDWFKVYENKLFLER